MLLTAALVIFSQLVDQEGQMKRSPVMDFMTGSMHWGKMVVYRSTTSVEAIWKLLCPGMLTSK